jgi:hypothetical protein
MRHLIIGAALVLGALLATATIAGYLESQATRRNATAGGYAPPPAPSIGKPVPYQQGRSLLNVVWRRSGEEK